MLTPVGLALAIYCATALIALMVVLLFCGYVVSKSGGKTSGLKDVADVLRAFSLVLRALLRVGERSDRQNGGNTT